MIQNILRLSSLPTSTDGFITPPPSLHCGLVPEKKGLFLLYVYKKEATSQLFDKVYIHRPFVPMWGKL